jgi:hypothetical protein
MFQEKRRIDKEPETGSRSLKTSGIYYWKNTYLARTSILGLLQINTELLTIMSEVLLIFLNTKRYYLVALAFIR